MATVATIGELLELLRTSEAVAGEVLDGWLKTQEASLAPLDKPKLLLTRLVAEGLLTAYQAEQLLSGRMRRFVIGGKYRILDRLGVGGMGTVYLCEHNLMRRRVALKVMPATKTQTALRDSFYREARAIGRLDHPNIVRAHDIDREEHLHYLVLEHVDGCSLGELVKREGPLPVDRAIGYVAQAASGLQHIHEAGLVHRDIKPANLLVDRRGVLKILDMGLVRFFHEPIDDQTRQRESTTILGTADYLPPEQVADSPAVDIRADIYSLGIVAYFLLTGTTPFKDMTLAQKMLLVERTAYQGIDQFRTDVPPEICAIIDRMIALDPAERYQTPLDVFDVLAPWASVVSAASSSIMKLPVLPADEAARPAHAVETATVKKIPTVPIIPVSPAAAPASEPGWGNRQLSWKETMILLGLILAAAVALGVLLWVYLSFALA